MTDPLGLTLDTGALVALERRERRVASLIESARSRGGRITVSTAVVVEWWRGQRGPVSRLLDAFEVEPLELALAKLAGLALTMVPPGPSPVDSIVMASAARRGDVVLTSDVDDLQMLTRAFPAVRVLRV